MRITDDQLEHWRQHGYVLVPNYLNEVQIDQALANVYLHFPTDGEYRAAPRRYSDLPQPAQTELPFAGDVLNDLAVHPDIVDFAERVIGTTDLRLTQSILWAKYAGRGDENQILHVDYLNNTLTFPSDAAGFVQLPSILYLTDVTVELGPTHIVSREFTPDDLLTPWKRAPNDFPDLYERECAVTVAAGTLLLYNVNIFHRGSRLTAKTGARFTFHNVYRAAGCDWMGWTAFPRHGLNPSMQRFLERASVRQRCLLGFPEPGHRFWTEQTVAGVGSRYPAMDMAPYRDACAEQSS